MPGPVQTLEYESAPGRWRFSSAPPDGALAGVVPSTIVCEAARLIEEAYGNLRIGSLPAAVGVSRKQLWLRFARELGMSPKAHARLQRFVWTLARLWESTSVEWPRLAVAAGYSDESHLVRDFRSAGW